MRSTRFSPGLAVSLITACFGAGCVPPELGDLKPDRNRLPGNRILVDDGFIPLSDGTRIHYRKTAPDDGRFTPFSLDKDTSRASEIQIAGSGIEGEESVIFVHGLNCNAKQADEYFEGSNSIVYSLDLLAHGLSDAAKVGPSDITRNVEALDALVEKAKEDGDTPTAYVGYSAGGRVISLWAAQHPDNEIKVVFINSHAENLHISEELRFTLIDNNPAIPDEMRKARGELLDSLDFNTLGLNIVQNLGDTNARFYCIAGVFDELIRLDEVKKMADDLNAQIKELFDDHVPDRANIQIIGSWLKNIIEDPK